MKIRTKDGTEIDLDELRQIIENGKKLIGEANQKFSFDKTGEPTEEYLRLHQVAYKAQGAFVIAATHDIEPLLDALVAALSVPFPLPEENSLHASLIRDGEYRMWRKVRDAIGIIDDDTAEQAASALVAREE